MNLLWHHMLKEVLVSHEGMVIHIMHIGFCNMVQSAESALDVLPDGPKGFHDLSFWIATPLLEITLLAIAGRPVAGCQGCRILIHDTATQAAPVLPYHDDSPS